MLTLAIVLAVPAGWFVGSVLWNRRRSALDHASSCLRSWRPNQFKDPWD
jgi:hypothetical protein